MISYTIYWNHTALYSVIIQYRLVSYSIIYTDIIHYRLESIIMIYTALFTLISYTYRPLSSIIAYIDRLL